MSNQRIIIADYHYFDPREVPPPAGVKMLLLTEQKTCVIGQWSPQGYIGWYPLPKIPAAMRGAK